MEQRISVKDFNCKKMAKGNLKQNDVAVLNSDLSRLEEELRLLSQSDHYGDQTEVEDQKRLIQAQIETIKKQLKSLGKDGGSFNTADPELDKAAERLLEQIRAK